MADSSSTTEVDDSSIFASDEQRRAVFLGKEVLLSRLSDQRPGREAITDRFFELSRRQAYYFTDIYVLAEVLASVRSGSTAAEAASVFEDAKQSQIGVLHGLTSWDESELKQTPKETMGAAMKLIAESPKHDVKFDEAALVLQAMGTENGCICSFDGAVRGLARSRAVETFPYVNDW